MTLSPSPFPRLRELLHGISSPAGLDSIQLHLGEFRVEPASGHFTPLANIDGWTRYPPLGGTADLRAAYARWLERRFGVRHSLHEEKIAIEPSPGTKQAIAVTVALAVSQARARGVGAPAVILPNPFYPTYQAAAEAAGAQSVFYALDGGNDASPIAAAVESVRARVAAIVVCNPGNPCGDILSSDSLREIGTIASGAQATLIVDECYTDLSCGEVPPGYLSVVEEGTAASAPFLVLHSLSKRSGAPGLRSGFVAGDPTSVAAYASYNRLCGVSTPLPVCAVASALWADDVHVSRLQSSLARNWGLADAIIGSIPRYRRAEAGLFVWLPVADDEATARQLWRHHAVTVMPGRYLGADDANGVNPGSGHVRVALVHGEAPMREALTRIRTAIMQNG